MLVTQILGDAKPDFCNESSRKELCAATLNELLKLTISPIINTNDAVAPPPEADVDLQGVYTPDLLTSLHILTAVVATISEKVQEFK